MIETGHYLGAFEGEEVVAIAGVHVYSERHRVAALGNVATHPRRRGQGLATAVTAALFRQLLGPAGRAERAPRDAASGP